MRRRGVQGEPTKPHPLWKQTKEGGGPDLTPENLDRSSVRMEIRMEGGDDGSQGTDPVRVRSGTLSPGNDSNGRTLPLGSVDRTPAAPQRYGGNARSFREDSPRYAIERVATPLDRRQCVVAGGRGFVCREQVSRHRGHSPRGRVLRRDGTRSARSPEARARPHPKPRDSVGRACSKRVGDMPNGHHIPFLRLLRIPIDSTSETEVEQVYARRSQIIAAYTDVLRSKLPRRRVRVGALGLLRKNDPTCLPGR